MIVIMTVISTVTGQQRMNQTVCQLFTTPLHIQLTHDDMFNITIQHMYLQTS